MSYSVLRLTTLYPSILKNHYQDEGLNNLTTYNDMHNKLINLGYGHSDIYERSLKKLYDVTSEIIIVNDDHLQTKWAQEHGVSLTKNGLVIEQIKFYKPSVVMIDDLYWVEECFINQIRKLPYVKLVYGRHCAPINAEVLMKMKLFDFIISCSPLLVEEYKKLGVKNTFLIYHAFDKDILTRVESKTESKSKSDVVFTGSFMLGNDMHDVRRELIGYLIKEKVKLKVYSDGTLYSKKQKLAFLMYNVLLKLMGKNKANAIFEKLHFGIDFRDQQFWYDLTPFLKPSLYGIDMYNALRSSRICINNHGGVAGNYAANMRLFEITGMGSCLLTDDKKNMNELFIPDVECVTYKNNEEAKEKINWLLSHPADLATIANAGQNRCLQDHTYEVRAKQLNEIILKFL